MSAIPQYYEGGPARQSIDTVSMLGNGTLAVGNAVSNTGQAAYTVHTSTTATDFFFGVVATTGGLANGAVNVIVRGVVDVVADAAISAGAFVKLSATTAGQVHAGSNLSDSRAVALNAASGAGKTIQVLLF